MPKFTQAMHIAAAPGRVFEQLSDFQGAPGRVRGIKKIEMLTNGPVGVGTRFRETRVMFGKEATETMEVASFDPPNGYTLGCESCGCRYRSEFRLTPRGGGTDVEMTFEAVPLTFLAKIMGVLMRPMLSMCKKQIFQDLQDIKDSIERGAGVRMPSAEPAA